MVYKVFRRPSIDLDAKRKTWEGRRADAIEIGATVPEHGEVVTIAGFTKGDDVFVTFEFLSGLSETYPAETILYSYQ